MKLTGYIHLFLMIFTIMILVLNIYDAYNDDDGIEIHETITIVRERQVYFERLEVNQRIQEIQAFEDYDKIINLYGNIAGDREIARL
ncbi:hypothetical protein LCGC14_2371750, partial [marine sediment metagenome]